MPGDGSGAGCSINGRSVSFLPVLLTLAASAALGCTRSKKYSDPGGLLVGRERPPKATVARGSGNAGTSASGRCDDGSDRPLRTHHRRRRMRGERLPRMGRLFLRQYLRQRRDACPNVHHPHLRAVAPATPTASVPCTVARTRPCARPARHKTAGSGMRTPAMERAGIVPARRPATTRAAERVRPGGGRVQLLGPANRARARG